MRSPFSTHGLSPLRRADVSFKPCPPKVGMSVAFGAKVSQPLRTLFALTLPGTHTRAVWVYWLFVAVQCADAAQTANGISRFGPVIEANPIISACIATFGANAALLGAKAAAVALGAVLLVHARHFVLAALTIGCVFGALVP
jgi:hypothetical protein